MPKETDKIIEPISDTFHNVSSAILKSPEVQKLPIALYQGVLPIGDIELDCAVLDNGKRILTAVSIFTAFGRARKGMNSRLEIDGTRMPPFLAAKNLEPFIKQDILSRTTLISYKDGEKVKTGYDATLLPRMCELYLSARRGRGEGSELTSTQEKLALQSEILLSALAQVGIEALVDEATGFQHDRKHNALRLLLSKYITEGLQQWVLTFPDSFFSELDRLYKNEKTTSQKRPKYYGNFINRYVYEPIEHGYVKEKLNELNISESGKRKARFHQWLSSEGKTILVHQIGRVQGLMEVFDNIADFNNAAKKQKQISIAPYLFDEMNKVID